MSQEITCPNCGGIIFSDDAGAMEMSPCTCTASSAPVQEPAASTAVHSVAAMSATRAVPPARPTGQSTGTETPKVCCHCGKDVTGRKRLKDSRGRYWCPSCAKKDERQKKVRKEQTKTACTLCGTEVEVQNLLSYDNQFVCPKCYREKKELEKAADARIGRINNAFKGTETRRMWPYYVVLGILAMIIVLRKLHFIGG